MTWRWDQGRLEYFRVKNVRKIAEVLSAFDGAPIGDIGAPDLLRGPLMDNTGLVFPPADNPRYKIWRNFGRVFGQQMLAAKIDNRLVVSEVCRKLAAQDESITDEEYIQFWVKRYTSPSPSFEDYDKETVPVFPFCSVIKLALARLTQNRDPITAEEVIAFLIGNEATGQESLSFYRNLLKSRLVLPDERVRQIREMIAVLGQLPFLKWEASSLSIDPTSLGSSFEADIMAYATPEPNLPRLDRAQEILNQGAIGGIILSALDLPLSSSEELTFIEGSRKRMTHFRIERSSKLRQIYMKRAPHPSLCNMCALDTRLRYPWTNTLIEVHHLLPLGSLLKVENTKTSLRDVIGVCPSCHKATHHFYRKWLSGNGLEDFRNEAEAREVFEKAKDSVVLAA